MINDQHWVTLTFQGHPITCENITCCQLRVSQIWNLCLTLPIYPEWNDVHVTSWVNYLQSELRIWHLLSRSKVIGMLRFSKNYNPKVCNIWHMFHKLTSRDQEWMTFKVTFAFDIWNMFHKLTGWSRDSRSCILSFINFHSYIFKLLCSSIFYAAFTLSDLDLDLQIIQSNITKTNYWFLGGISDMMV